jgi:DNA helicase HerA-like ATPase
VEDGTIFVGAAAVGAHAAICLELKRANRHGLIAGATGTGKTVTLQGMVEGFSRAGVPVFVADVKGDLAGLAMAGSPTARTHEAFAARAAEIGMVDWRYGDNPVIFWDLFGQAGHPVRTTISEMGPLLLARLMGLNDTQEGVLSLVFKVADEQGLLLLDLEDLRAMLAWTAENAADLSARYGNVTRASVGTIQRQLLQLESQGGDGFFGEPALDIADMMLVDESGRGTVSVLAADRLMAAPKLYATFLLWLLSELFETLPEVGDADKPKLVFFFDEAHLLFDDAAPALVDKVEQVVRLIRSKGVGVYFISQNPIDIPDDVGGQLGNRVQHKLNAFTPREQKAVRAAAETFRASPGLNVAHAITELKVGEALVSLLQPDGAPSPVARTLIRPPFSRVGPLTAEERAIFVSTSPVAGKYETLANRESAAEMLAAKAGDAKSAAQRAAAEAEAAKAQAEQARMEAAQARLDAQAEARARAAAMREAARPTLADQMLRSAARSAATSIGRQIGGQVGGQILRGLLGGLFKGR